jgi:hypothetical protein
MRKWPNDKAENERINCRNKVRGRYEADPAAYFVSGDIGV